MFQQETAKKLLVCCLITAAVSGLGDQALLAQGGQTDQGKQATSGAPAAGRGQLEDTGTVSAAVPLPPVEPKLDQLGQMLGVTLPDRTGLVLMLFLQVVGLVVVAIALAGHLSLPGRKKTPKA